MKSSNTFSLIKLGLVGCNIIDLIKSVLSNLFDPAGHMRINLEAAGRNSKLKSRDKNSLNKMNIINYMNVLQGRAYVYEAFPLVPSTTTTPDNWSTVDNTHRNNHWRNLRHDFPFEFLTQTLKMI